MEIDSEPWRKTVIRGAQALEVTVSAEQARAMGRHALELLQWNRITNLTAITDPLEVAVKHYVDALAPASWIGHGARVLDAGSGGGFPGIPLAIARPDLTITLVDSVRKKVSFLKYAIRTLGLNSIDAIHGRLEELGGRPPYHEKFDLVVSRAFSSLEDFTTLALPFLTPAGTILAMRGPEADNGQPALDGPGMGTTILAGRSFCVTVHRYRLPVLGADRRLVQLTLNT